MSSWIRRICGMILAGAVLAAPCAFAQFSASVQGNVQDASGAAVSNADVTLLNNDTKVSQMRAADQSGTYRFPSLAPGHYRSTLVSAAVEDS